MRVPFDGIDVPLGVGECPAHYEYISITDSDGMWYVSLMSIHSSSLINPMLGFTEFLNGMSG